MFKTWRRKRILKRAPLPERLWRTTTASLPLLRGLRDEDLKRLRDLVVLFLHEKDFSPAGGLTLTDEMRVLIGAQACLPILNLGIDYYAGWRAIVVYPDEFVPMHEYVDEAGVVHTTRHPVMGESWLRGPLILSAADAQRSGAEDGINVVIHEVAHKLDMLNGDANGFPPLHGGMHIEEWTQVFSTAYASFCAQVETDADTPIDPYGAESPAEFFAVLSEAFFEIPWSVKAPYPDVYRALVAFYRQDPALRLDG